MFLARVFVTLKPSVNDPEGLTIKGGLRDLGLELKVAHFDAAACRRTSIAIVDDACAVGEYSSVTIGENGLPVISYYASTGSDLKVAHCRDSACRVWDPRRRGWHDKIAGAIVVRKQ